MEQGTETLKKPRLRVRKRWLLTVGMVVVLTAGGGLAWRLTRPASSLLPSSITKQITGFTPYFYYKSIPASYTIDTAHASVNGGILFIPLSSTSGSTLVLTEQALPSSVSRQDLQTNGSGISDTAGPATINDIEGRKLGTMIAGKTLILLNGQNDTLKDDMTALLQQLKPLQH